LKALFKTILGGFLLGGLLALPRAHCPDRPPIVKMSYPSSEISVQDAFWEDFGITFIDTFHQDTLHKELNGKFRDSRHAIIGILEKMDPRKYPDTIRFADTFYVEWKVEETLHFRVLGVLKGDAPSTLVLKDTAYFYEPPLSPTTYRSLVGKSFLAMFNSYDYVRDMGLGPEDGCFFEFTAYALQGGRIHKKGLEGQRMPGISVPLKKFLAGLGEPLPAHVQLDSLPKSTGLGAGKRFTRRLKLDKPSGGGP
jgi:hypothetical protein